MSSTLMLSAFMWTYGVVDVKIDASKFPLAVRRMASALSRRSHADDGRVPRCVPPPCRSTSDANQPRSSRLCMSGWVGDHCRWTASNVPVQGGENPVVVSFSATRGLKFSLLTSDKQSRGKALMVRASTSKESMMDDSARLTVMHWFLLAFLPGGAHSNRIVLTPCFALRPFAGG